jgi:predicted nucleotidyltransferase
MENPFAVLSRVASTLEQQGITYVLVGSLASSMHGMYRSTADIDILADVKRKHVLPLISALQDSFYIDEHAVTRAIDLRQSFNAIHFDSAFKVDIFIPKTDAFTKQQLERRELRRISPDVNMSIYVATAEDTILAKLRWYLSGGKVSNTQWGDVVGIIGGYSGSLDLDYLYVWANKLGLTELLNRAFAEATTDCDTSDS